MEILVAKSGGFCHGVKKAVDTARDNLKLYNKRTYLMLDECHRFNKTQSDSLLPAIDIGTYLVQT